jgi:hypothetical protein
MPIAKATKQAAGERLPNKMLRMSAESKLNSPYSGMRELGEKEKLAELTLTVSPQVRSILYEIMRKTAARK